jgi:hypothetical protein
MMMTTIQQMDRESNLLCYFVTHWQDTVRLHYRFCYTQDPMLQVSMVNDNGGQKYNDRLPVLPC